MNYLSHLFLADWVTSDPAEIAGNMMGDFVKGRLQDQYPPPVVRGLVMHREVDRFTDHHAQVQRCKALFPQGVRRYAGIALDIYFDYLLSRYWARFSDQQRPDFIQRQYALLTAESDWLPDELARLLPHIVADDWLGGYADLTATYGAIERTARHLRRPDGLLSALAILQRETAVIDQAYLEFFPELLAFVEAWSAREMDP